jgi:hypothetical protein
MAYKANKIVTCACSEENIIIEFSHNNTIDIMDYHRLADNTNIILSEINFDKVFESTHECEEHAPKRPCT